MTYSTVVEPHPETGGAYHLTYTRDFCEIDLAALRQLTPEEITERAELYFQNFRLVIDERGGGFVDSTGAWYPIPTDAVRMVTHNMDAPLSGGVDAHADQIKRLIFLDATGRPVLVLPNYGWNIPDLEAWAQRIGLDTEITYGNWNGDEIARDKLFPGYRKAPIAPIGRPYQEPKQATPLGTRLKTRLGFGRS